MPAWSRRPPWIGSERGPNGEVSAGSTTPDDRRTTGRASSGSSGADQDIMRARKAVLLPDGSRSGSGDEAAGGGAEAIIRASRTAGGVTSTGGMPSVTESCGGSRKMQSTGPHAYGIRPKAPSLSWPTTENPKEMSVNPTEMRMLDMLKKGRDQFGVVAVKAEFEAEGTRPEEFLRLLELARRADIKVALKIGGCEAISDLHASKIYGVDHIIAPMVETPYALSKYVDARTKTYGPDATGTHFLFNLETQSALDNLGAMLPLAKAELDGIVFGRVDFTLSRGLPRNAVNDPSITEAVVEVARACAAADLELVVGGSVGIEATNALREIRAIRLDRFETRKIVFDGAAIDSARFEAGIANAVAFELAWLENKRDHYRAIADEDLPRIRMIQERSARAARALLTSVAA